VRGRLDSAYDLYHTPHGEDKKNMTTQTNEEYDRSDEIYEEQRLEELKQEEAHALVKIGVFK
jgi:hypothetical protein